MATKYVTKKTAELYDGPTGGARDLILIFGDEVEVTGTEVNGRLPAKFRDRIGYLKSDCLGDKPALEFYFIDVGTGDSTFIVTPGRKKILIDGGLNRRARGFLAWKYGLDKPGTSVDIDLLVLSHADKDHIKGLAPIINHPQINVRKVVDSGVATCPEGAYKTELGDLDPTEKFLVTRHNGLSDLAGMQLSDEFTKWYKALVRENVAYSSVDSSCASLGVGDSNITVEVLGPRLVNVGGRPALPYFGSEKGVAINGNSVVLRLRYGNVYALMSGDVNIEGGEHLVHDPNIAARMQAHILKAPHHGSDKYCPAFLQAVRPQISVISSGDDVDHGHPRAIFIGTIGKVSRCASPLVFSTEIAANFIDVPRPANTPAPAATTTLASAKRSFKRRLHGMINVRTDGQQLFAARRVMAPYQWESYGPIAPMP